MPSVRPLYWKTKVPEVSMHHLPSLYQFSVDGARRGRFIVPHLLCGLLEEGYQAKKLGKLVSKIKELEPLLKAGLWVNPRMLKGQSKGSVQPAPCHQETRKITCATGSPFHMGAT